MRKSLSPASGDRIIVVARKGLKEKYDGYRRPLVLHVNDDGKGLDENVRVPDSCHAEVLMRLYLHPVRAVRAVIA